MRSLFSEDNRDLALTGKQQEGAALDSSREHADCEIANTRGHNERRRIVDSNYVATEVTCEKCSGRVLLMNIVKELNYESMFTVICFRPCSHSKKVAKRERKEEEEDGSRPFCCQFQISCW